MRRSSYRRLLIASASAWGLVVAAVPGCDDETETTPTGSGTTAGTATGTTTGTATGGGSTTGTPSGSGSGSDTQTGTSTGCEAPTDSGCIQSCEDLYACIQEEDAQCPGLQGMPEEDYLCGTDSDGCFAQCDANPALEAVVDPFDCAGTVGTLLGLNQTFADDCEAGGGGSGGDGG